MIYFSNIKKGYKNLKDEIDKAVISVLESGFYVLGQEVQRFEQEFAEYCGSKFAIGVGSGTDALQLALMASGVSRGDEVITVPNTAVPTVTAISSIGAQPVFVDIDPVYYTLDPDLLENAITKKTKAIIPVHIYGQAANIDIIVKIAKLHSIPVIEDACQAHGASCYIGKKTKKKAGSIGDLGCFSFYPTKNLGAYGDGGMIVTDDESMAQKIKMLRNYGQEDRYHHRIKGINSRLDELHAAILRIKLKELDNKNEIRRKKAGLYTEHLKNYDIILPKEAEYARHVYHLYVIRIPDRDALQKHLLKHNIQTLIHYPVPVHMQEAYSDLNCLKGSFPASENISREILSLPLYPEIEDKDIIYVCENIISFYEH